MTNESTKKESAEPIYPRKVWSEILKVYRVEYDDCKNPQARCVAEKEAMQDLSKPLEQLLSDVHEEAETNPDRSQRVASALKRMVSLQVKVVRSNELLNRRIFWLTIAIAVMTAIMIVFNVIPLFRDC